MCGITGYWSLKQPDSRIVERMASHIENRGPHDAGSWSASDAGLALAHRRLSVLDLSPAGHQPMHSICGRHTLVYNGEVYNHLDLRVELENEAGSLDWRGHSATETLLACLPSLYGIKK
jgi:asparagine synthase (glutamine-hydrolysing)